MKRSFLVASALAAITAAATPVIAHADDATLGWSYANVAVGSCTAVGAGCTAAHPPVYQHIQIDQGFNHDATAIDSDPHLGSSVAFADVGVSSVTAGGASFEAPALHASTTGAASTAALPYSWNYAFTEGVIGYVWNGPDMAIPLSTFAGTLDYTSNEQTYGQVAGSFALLNNAVEDAAAGLAWSQTNLGQFTTNCSSPGAGGIATTGVVPTGTGPQSHTLAAAQQCSGNFDLVTGQRFYIWSQLEVFDLGAGFVDASHTFSVGFSATASADLQALITQNAVVVPSTNIAFGVPEPANWMLIILGMGAVGGALRRSRRTAARLAA